MGQNIHNKLRNKIITEVANEEQEIGTEPLNRDMLSAYLRPEDADREYRPHRVDTLREHDINIQFLSIGCVIRVGCKTIPFNTIEDAMKELNEYVINPFDIIKKWNKIFAENK